MSIETPIELHVYSSDEGSYLIRTNITSKRIIVMLTQAYDFSNIKLVKIISNLDTQTEEDEEDCDFEFISSKAHIKISLAKQKSEAKTNIIKLTKEVLALNNDLKKKYNKGIYISSEKVYNTLDKYINSTSDLDISTMSKTSKCWFAHKTLPYYEKYLATL